MKYNITHACEWVWENRGLWISKQYMGSLCSSNRIKSEIIGHMRFIDTDDLEKFDFKKPGRPKNDK